MSTCVSMFLGLTCPHEGAQWACLPGASGGAGTLEAPGSRYGRRSTQQSPHRGQSPSGRGPEPRAVPAVETRGWGLGCPAHNACGPRTALPHIL